MSRRTIEQMIGHHDLVVEDYGAEADRRENPPWWRILLGRWSNSDLIRRREAEVFRSRHALLELIDTVIAAEIVKAREKDRLERAEQEMLEKLGRFVGGPIDGEVVPESAPETVYIEALDLRGLKWSYTFQVKNESGMRVTANAFNKGVKSKRWKYVSRGDANRYLKE